MSGLGPGVTRLEIHEDDRLSDTGAAGRMFAAVRVRSDNDRAVLDACIDATQACAQAATACADTCPAGETVEELRGCIRTLLDTADVCHATARVLSRATNLDSAVTPALLTACWAACRQAREVCEEFLPVHAACGVCAQASQTAERACRALLTTTGARTPRTRRVQP